MTSEPPVVLMHRRGPTLNLNARCILYGLLLLLWTLGCRQLILTWFMPSFVH